MGRCPRFGVPRICWPAAARAAGTPGCPELRALRCRCRQACAAADPPAAPCRDCNLPQFALSRGPCTMSMQPARHGGLHCSKLSRKMQWGPRAPCGPGFSDNVPCRQPSMQLEQSSTPDDRHIHVRLQRDQPVRQPRRRRALLAGQRLPHALLFNGRRVLRVRQNPEIVLGCRLDPLLAGQRLIHALLVDGRWVLRVRKLANVL